MACLWPADRMRGTGGLFWFGQCFCGLLWQFNGFFFFGVTVNCRLKRCLTLETMTKPTQEMIDEANKQWPVSRYDKEGRIEHEKLRTAKDKCKTGEYNKWPAMKRYLLEMHFPKMQKLFIRQEKERATEEDQQTAAEEAREGRLAKLAGNRTREKDSEETYQRRTVVTLNSFRDYLLK